MFTFLSTLSLSLSVSLFPSLATFFHPQGSDLRLCKLSINISYSRKRQTTIGCTNTHNNCNNCLDFTPRSPAQCRRFGLVKCNNFYHTHKSDFLQRFVAQPAAATVSCFGQSRSKRERERETLNRSRKNCSTLQMPQIFPKEMQEILLCAARFPRKQRKRATSAGLVDKFFPYTKSSRSRSR